MALPPSSTRFLWVKQGLPTIDDKRPKLILGRDLFTFLQSKRIKNKRPCKLGEMSGHGFRAMARTTLYKVLGVRPDYIEHQLAHAVRDPY
jgi:integrase